MPVDLSFALAILPHLATAAIVTVQATVAGFALAVVFGLLLFVGQQAGNRAVARLLHVVMDFIRSTPLLVQLYTMYFVLPEFGIRLSPMTGGVLVLGLHYGCYAAETYRAAYLSVRNGQWEAAFALGLSGRQAVGLVILPQMLPVLVVGLGNSLIILFKESATLSAIGVMELLTQAKEIGAENFSYTEPITIAGLIYLVLSLLTASLVALVERRPERNTDARMRNRPRNGSAAGT